jgi:hypothetical protein
MAFIFRQFQEGDTFFSVQGVGNTPNTDCWVDNNGVYKDNQLFIVVNSLQYPLPASNVISLGNGYLYFTLPTSTGLTSSKDTTTLQLRSYCNSEVSDVKTALPVGFNLGLPSTILTCNETISLIPTLQDRVRLFFAHTSPSLANIVKLTLNGSVFDRPSTFLEAGFTNNVNSAGGVWTETGGTTNSVYWSNNLYTPTNTLLIEPSTMNYFTVRLGYIELVFDSVNLTVINYLTALQTSLGSYLTTDDFVISSTINSYSVTKNNVTVFQANKSVSYSATGGTVVPSSGLLGSTVNWNLPTAGGTYNVNLLFSGISLTKSVTIENCTGNVFEMIHTLSGFNFKGCSEGSVELYRNNIRVATIELNVLGEASYTTSLSGYYQFKINCSGTWSALSCYQYFSFKENCKCKSTTSVPNCNCL